MQDIHTLIGVCGGGGGGGGRIFTSGGVDRRLQPQLPIKCPRCDSQNTKFCYYNNYNLSQPRHFCKNCRRYWTKGGVLRNVPIGGGCRKSKRSSKTKSKSPASTSTTTAAVTTAGESSKKNEESSSSESSSLTGTTTMAVKTVAGDGTAAMGGGSNSTLNNLSEKIASFVSSEGKMFPIITNMVGSSNGQELVGPNQEWKNEEEKMMAPTINKFVDQDHEVQVQVDLAVLEQGSREGNSGLATLDWGNVGTGGGPVVIDKTEGDNVGGGNGGEDGLFDFGGVDEGYWNQAQWVDDNDQNFNFLPQFQVLDFNLGKK